MTYWSITQQVISFQLFQNNLLVHNSEPFAVPQPKPRQKRSFLHTLQQHFLATNQSTLKEIPKLLLIPLMIQARIQVGNSSPQLQPSDLIFPVSLMLLFWVPNPIIGQTHNLACWASFCEIWGPIMVLPWALEDVMGCSSCPLSVSLIK